MVAVRPMCILDRCQGEAWFDNVVVIPDTQSSLQTKTDNFQLLDHNELLISLPDEISPDHKRVYKKNSESKVVNYSNDIFLQFLFFEENFSLVVETSSREIRVHFNYSNRFSILDAGDYIVNFSSLNDIQKAISYLSNGSEFTIRLLD